jgi:FMN phosphatase YigB (HAD superfamily)
MIDTVLFDLDGTLLPMDQEKFINTYLGLLAKKLAPHGYEPNHLVAAVWAGTRAMMENTGEKTNEEVFWEDFCHIFGEGARKDLPLFEEFYAADFAGARTVCGFEPAAGEILALLREKGIRLALATNPLFPAIATRQRIRWAGLDPEDFELITSYENSSRCKPDPGYYREVLDKLGVRPENCLMVGNDVQEDMLPARELGMEVFLLTPCLIDREDGDRSRIPQGGFPELKDFLLKVLKNR